MEKWKEENIKPHLFTEVEVCDDGESWEKRKLNGFRSGGGFSFLADGVEWQYMRLIPEKKTRLMTPTKLAGKWLDFGDRKALVIDCDNFAVYTRIEGEYFGVDELACGVHGCRGWRDTPDGELHTSFEVEQ